MSTIPLTLNSASPLSNDDTAPNHADYILSPDVLFISADDGSARLLDLGGQFFSVSEVGAIMLQIVLKRGVEAAVQEVSTRFAANSAQVRRDLIAMLADFEQKGLIRPADSTNRAPRRAERRALAWIVALPLPLILAAPVSMKVKGFALLALARLSCALGGWTATIRAWTPRTGRPAAFTTTAMEVDRAVRAAASAHVFQVACKERALSCWALARKSGLSAELVVGITFFPVAGHCWCEVGELPISDDVRRISDFRPVARWA